MPVNIQPEGSSYRDKLCKGGDEERKDVTNPLVFKSSWAKEMSEISLGKQLEKNTGRCRVDGGRVKNGEKGQL